MKENIYGDPTPESQGESWAASGASAADAQPTQQVPAADAPGYTAAQPTQQVPTPQAPPAPHVEPAHAAAGNGPVPPTMSWGPAASAAPEPEPAPESFSPEPKPKKSYRGLKAVVAGLLGGVIGAGVLTAALLGTGVIGKGHTQLTSGTTQQVTIDPNDEDTTIANAVAAKALPSVVSVYCSYEDGSSGMGSGVIYDKDGNIITNNHVIENASSITVTIDGKSYTAELVGTDASSDVAVVKAELNGDSVTPIEVGSSADLQVGDWVMSVGSPFGLENSVSQGIVSALYRNTLMQNTSGNTLYTNLIQVDASINPGNSGGALVDDQGKLVGICTLYSSDTESFAGIGFAIPGDYATDIADKIIAGETVTHAYIGLSMSTVNARNAKANKLSVNYGAYVGEVTEGGPADEAGIQVGDVIIGIGNTEVTSSSGAILAVRSHKIGETVTVTVMRGSEEKTFDVTLGSDEALQAQQNGSDSNGGSGSGNGSGTGDTGDDQGITLEQLQEWYEQMLEQQQNQDTFGRRR